MKIRSVLAVAACSALVDAQVGVQPPVTKPEFNVPTSQGCFNSAVSSWTKSNDDRFNSVGQCTRTCRQENKPVAALSGESCFCGDTYPPRIALVADSFCNYPCPAYIADACGGIMGKGYYSVYNVGTRLVVQNAQPGDVSSKPDLDQVAEFWTQTRRLLDSSQVYQFVMAGVEAVNLFA